MNRPMASHRRKRPLGGARPRPKPAVKEPQVKVDDRFRVLIAVHRPRYRSRAERAVDLPGWAVRSLLNKEDPIGLMNQKPPHVLILSADFGRNKSLGFMKAAQKFRSDDMKIIGIFEDADEAGGAAELCDSAFSPPWKTLELRALAAQMYAEIRGEAETAKRTASPSI